MTPEAKGGKLEKPDPNVYCPISGKRLRLKDLIPVKFTPVDKTKYGPCLALVTHAKAETLTQPRRPWRSGTARRPLDEVLVQKERWMCPITLTVLTNA